MTQQVATGEQPKAPSPPQPLLVARWLWIGITLIGAVRSLIQVADRQALITRVQEIQPKLSQEELDTAANGEVLFAILVSLLTIACYLMFANRMREGRNWARIVLAVLGGLNALGMVITLCIVAVLGTALVHQMTGLLIKPWDLVSGAVTLVMAAVALVLMFHRDANRFFRETRAGPRVDTR